MRMDTYSGLVSITMGSYVYNIEMWMKTVKFYIIFLREEDEMMRYVACMMCLHSLSEWIFHFI